MIVSYHHQLVCIGQLTLDNRVNRATLLAVAAVDTLGHVDIISCRPATSILTLLGFNGNGLGRADGFAELAGDATLFTGGVPTEGVFTTETRGNGTLFEGIVDCVSIRSHIRSTLFLFCITTGYERYLRWSEELFQHHVHTPEHLRQQKVFTGLIHRCLSTLIPSLRGGQSEARLRGTVRRSCPGHRGREVCGRAHWPKGRSQKVRRWPAVGDQPCNRLSGCHCGLTRNESEDWR